MTEAAKQQAIGKQVNEVAIFKQCKRTNQVAKQQVDKTVDKRMNKLARWRVYKAMNK